MRFEIPVGAVPGHCEERLYPKDKLNRKKGLNFKEHSEFMGICRFGTDQLIGCYGDQYWRDDWLGDGYSKNDFMYMCKDCPYSLSADKGGREFYSIIEPHFILDKYEELIDFDSPKYFVYFISDSTYVKIGVANDVKNRISSLQTGNALELELLCLIGTKDMESAYELERNLHFTYERFVKSGEWYNILNIINVPAFKEYFNPKDYKVATKVGGDG